MIDSLVKGESFPLEDWRRDWIGLTNKWQSSRNLFPVKASGDALNISRWLYDKYLCSDNLQSLYMGSNYDEAANFVIFYVWHNLLMIISFPKFKRILLPWAFYQNNYVMSCLFHNGFLIYLSRRHCLGNDMSICHNLSFLLLCNTRVNLVLMST